MLIRPLRAADFTTLATYRNALEPEQMPVTAQVLQAREAAATNERSTELVIVLAAETIVVTARYVEARPVEERPGTFWLYCDSLPALTPRLMLLSLKSCCEASSRKKGNSARLFHTGSAQQKIAASRMQ